MEINLNQINMTKSWYKESYIEMNTRTDESTLEDVSTDTGVKNSPRVLLFNDETHSFDEVINQLIKALKCTYDHAEALTWDVHKKGQASVYEGDIDECIRVSSILEEIELHTQILM